VHARPLTSSPTLVFVLCVVWGSYQVASNSRLPDAGPIARPGIRSGVGALCVIAYGSSPSAASSRLTEREAAGALAGELFTPSSSALYESLRFTTAAARTVLFTPAPFFVAVGAAFLLRDERLRPIMAGVAFAFGVACGFLGRTKGGVLAGDALALLAAVFGRRRPS